MICTGFEINLETIDNNIIFCVYDYVGAKNYTKISQNRHYPKIISI